MFLKVNIQSTSNNLTSTHIYILYTQHVVIEYRLLDFSFIAANEACLTRLINPLTFKTLLVPDSQFCNLVMLAPPGRRLSRFLDEIFSFLRRFEQLVAALTSLLPRLTKLWLK